jgi:hypothetical protein
LNILELYFGMQTKGQFGPFKLCLASQEQTFFQTYFFPTAKAETFGHSA